MDQSLVSLMRNINDALQLDKDSRDKEAYVRYLDCIFCITCNLQQSVRDGGGDVVVSKHVTKQVKLMQQCVERVAVLVDKIGSTQKPVVQRSPMEEVATRPKPFVMVPPLPFESTANTYARTRDITPMEIANMQNQQLMAAYRARMARMNKRDPGAFNLSLTIQRKMAENMAIAKKNEMALAKKMQERQARLEEQAAKRFATPIGMSEEEQEQRQIYKKILEYEQDAKWLQAWRAKLNANPQEPELICQLIQETLRCRDHPLTVLLKQYQVKVYEKIYPLVNNKTHRLAVVTVPLDKSLWPSDLCDSKIEEECKLQIFPRVNGNKDGNAKDDDGSAGLTRQESVSVSPDVERDELPLETNAEGSANPVGLTSEKGVSGEMNSTSSMLDNKDSVFADANRERNSCKEECQDSDEYQSNSKQTTGKSTPSAVKNDLTISFCGNAEGKIIPSCTEDCHESNTDNYNENQSQETNTATYADLESHSELNRATEEINTDSDNSSASLSDNEKKFAEGGEGETFPPSDTECTGDTMVQLSEDIKKDLSTATEKGEHVQAQLRAEQAKATRVLRLISEDYDSYNAENMDDLFDDEDDAEEMTNCAKEEIKSDRLECDLPESDQASSVPATYPHGPDSLVSCPSSGSSVQEFPSLSPGDSGQVDFERMSKEAYQRHVKNISTDVHKYMEKLLVLFTIAYEQLDSPVGRDQCYASLEETFFKPLWKFLLMLFRLANYKDELTISCKMTQKMDVNPRDVGVRKKLCLIPETGESSCKGNAQPYQQAIAQLRCIKDHYTMLSKLECVVKVVRQVCDSVKEFYVSQGFKPADVPSVGADDLVPVISYVVLQSRLPQLVSECHAMSEFIHEGYIMGQEGYCLTTLETAVSYIVTSDLNSPCSPS